MPTKSALVIREAANHGPDNQQWVRLKARPDRFPVAVYTNGRDILMPNIVATCFGGHHDKGDDGATSSGIRTDLPGGIAGCALPLPFARACRGTPLPVLPWRTRVIVQSGDVQITVPLIDVGPAGGLKSLAMVDLTEQAVQSLFPRLERTAGLANWWSSRVTVYIPGVAQHLRDYLPWGVDKDADYLERMDRLIGLSVCP